MAYSQSFLEKMSEESYAFICTTCDENHNKTIEAVRYCVECGGYCCQTCTDSHKLFPTLRNHNLLDVSKGGKKKTGLPEFPTERCSLHKGKLVELYCEDHDDVGCSVCIATNHRSCRGSSIHYVPETIDSLFKLVDVKRINKHLNNKMFYMTSLRNSNDTKLDALKEAKREAEKQVEIFEKALISIIRKSAKDSKSEIDAKFQELENDILQDKHNIDAVNDELQQSEVKLKKSDGNRAQRFVCGKQAEKHLKEADSLMIKQEKRSRQDTSLSFSPNQSVMNYVKGLHGIGQVYVRRKKLDMYRIKGQKDINIKISGDSKICEPIACCLTQDNKLLVTDYWNKKLKRINLDTMVVEDSCKLDGYPDGGVCCISDKQVAVACTNPNSIQFVSIDQKMSPTRLIKLPHKCYGIAFNDNKLYVTDLDSSLYVYNMDGTLINTITCNNTGTKLFTEIRHVTFNEYGDKMFVADAKKGLICLDRDGNYLSTVGVSDLKWAFGVCVDSNGCVFVTGGDSHNVIQYNEDGKKMCVIIKLQDELFNPLAVCFHQKLNILFVTMCDSDVVKMYELE